MARGNDAQTAAAEFRGQYGMMGNAEDLIQANRAAYPADLRTAQLAPADEQAKADLDSGAVRDAFGVEGGTVLDYAVRGRMVVAVIETESGYTYKSATTLGSITGDEDAPEQTDEQKLAAADAQANQILAQARMEAQAIIDQAVADAQEEASAAAQARVEEADQVRADAASDVESAGDQSDQNAQSETSSADTANPPAPSDPDGTDANPSTKAAAPKRARGAAGTTDRS